MCELFGMAGRLPTTVALSLGLLAQRGSAERRLVDGWGVAFHDGADALILREPSAAADSAWIGQLRSHQPASRVVIAHIRHVTQGELSLRNTQPFQRELGGRVHVFAHADRRTQPGGGIAPPGLTMLRRACPIETDALPVAGARLGSDTGAQVVTLFASVRLTDEPCHAMAVGTLVATGDGAVAAMVSP